MLSNYWSYPRYIVGFEFISQPIIQWLYVLLYQERCRMACIESRLRLSREKLLALGLLLGCDFMPKGVPGVGYIKALDLMEQLSNDGLLQRQVC